MNKRGSTSKNIFIRITVISGLFLLFLFACSALLNIYFQPKSDILVHVNTCKDAIVEEIKALSPDNEIMKKFREIEAKYGVMIESIMPDGSISYSTFSDEIYVGKEFEQLLTDEDIKSKVPIKKLIDYDKESVEKVRIYGFEKLDVKNTDSEYILYETKLDANGFQSGNTLKIYFGTYEYYTTLKESGINRVVINAMVLLFAWFILTFVLMLTYVKIRKINLAVKDVRRELLNPDYDKMVPADPSELGRLGRNINIMVADAREKVSELLEENERLNAKLESKQRKDDDKKDFLANTAHELKTPISIIRGCAEGLKFGIAKGGRARQKYCDTIIDESEKMNDLVLELLDLSKYNQKMYENVVEENFSIRSFVQGNLNSMESIFKEHSIEVKNTINRSYIGRTDIEKQNLVLRNYIKNAISHVDMYKKIVISCEEKPHAYRINVFNSGEKISESEKDKIWDSFYRVDKSHGRTEGRYGIGLQIVASIQDVLKMDYGVRNVHGGVQFWFDVKKAGKE